MASRILIVGGVAGGATAAARLSRLNRSLQITMLERSPDVSFANCGLPYYLGGEIKDRSRLSLQTPQSLERALGIRVLTQTEATKVDKQTRTVHAKGPKGEQLSFPFDRLILSPGAAPIVPAGIQIDHKKIFTLRNLQDMDYIHAAMSSPSCHRVVVVGAGFIGLEVAEQLIRIGKEVVLVEKSPAILPQVDEEIAKMVQPSIQRAGVQLLTGHGLVNVTEQGNGVTVTLDSGILSADAVILAIGVRPDTRFLSDSGIDLTPRGYIPVDPYLRTSSNGKSDDSIYAVGDAVETNDMVFPHMRATVALGNLANMQARIAADHIVRGDKGVTYPGSLGTSIVRVFDDVIALTGWSERRLKNAGIPYESVTVTDHNHAGYYPGSLPITIKLLFDPSTGRVLGAQAVGVDGVDKRIDVIAMAIQNQMSVEDLSLAQLCYSPPFGSARDAVTTAALTARNVRDGLHSPSHTLIQPNRQIIDVRPPELAQLHPLPNSKNIPLLALPETVKSLDRTVPVMTVCSLGKSSYFASRILAQNGFDVKSLDGGLKLHSPAPPPSPSSSSSPSSPSSSSSSSPPPQASITIDCSGLSCPGPLLKLRAESQKANAGDVITVTATDPGFLGDLPAFAGSNGFEVLKLESSKGVITGQIRKVGGGASSSCSSSSSSSCSVTGGSGSGSGVSAPRKGATIVVFSEEMDKVLAAFVIANGAAAMGGNVTMFFTFWGLNALRQPGRKSNDSKGVLDNMFSGMLPTGFDNLPLSHMNFGGLGGILMKKKMAMDNLPNCHSLLEDARKQGVRMVACTMSMTAMGIRKEELIDGVELGGVAEFLAASEKSGTNLFI